MKAGPPQVAERHRHLFKDYMIARTENFNPEDMEFGASWVKTLPVLNKTVIDYSDWYQRQRLRSLQAVDEMVDEIVQRLDKAGILENTCIVYTSDNGYHISQHRMHPGKECSYETDINVPFIIRGPDIPKNKITQAVTSHTDLAPTFLSLAGIPLRPDFDGQPLPLQKLATDTEMLQHKVTELYEGDGDELRGESEHVGIEFWGLAIPEGKYGYKGKYGFEGGIGNAYPNNTYKGLRIKSTEYNLYYSVWCTNERELYDMQTDPGQIRNLLRDERTLQDTSLCNRSLHHLVTRLDALMRMLKSCKGHTCTHPWETLHPVGEVKTLREALDDRFNAFYADHPKVRFEECRLGYFPEVEGSMEVNAYDGRGGWKQSRSSGQRPLFDADLSIMT